MIRYITSGVCAAEIIIGINEGNITSLEFIKGCNGNLKAVSSLAIGMKPEEVIKKLEGIKCGTKDTSCPDQLAQALKKAIGK